MKIWVDDIREPPDKGWLWFLSSNAALEFFKFCKRNSITVHEVSLDHDLGGEDTTRFIVRWFCEADFWPVEVKVHSANPVGREWLEGMIDYYKPEKI